MNTQQLYPLVAAWMLFGLLIIALALRTAFLWYRGVYKAREPEKFVTLNWPPQCGERGKLDGYEERGLLCSKHGFTKDSTTCPQCLAKTRKPESTVSHETARAYENYPREALMSAVDEQNLPALQDLIDTIRTSRPQA